MNVPEILEEMAKTYRDRNAVYGDNFRRVGNIMDILFPSGIKLEGYDDFNRWHIFELIIIKLTRYAMNYDAGGHQDSIHDMAVYSAMLEMIDAELKGIKDDHI